jgi:hypothetical protein
MKKLTLSASVRAHLHSAFVNFISGYGQVTAAVWNALKTEQSAEISAELDAFAPDEESSEKDRETYQKLRYAVNAAARRYAEDNKEVVKVFRKPKGATSHMFTTPTAPRGNSKKAKGESAEKQVVEINQHTFGLAINSIIESLDKTEVDGLRLVADYVAKLVEDRVKTRKAA